jgi:hypothetical protein
MRKRSNGVFDSEQPIALANTEIADQEAFILYSASCFQ